MLFLQKQSIEAPEIGKMLVPIFQRLSDKDLLKRCARNKTLNPNEFFHNIIWKICPKTIFVGKRTVTLAACQFSMGLSFQNVLCRIMNLSPGKHLERRVEIQNIERIKRAEKAASDKGKKRRKNLKYKKITKQTDVTGVDGKSYAAGAFDY